MGTSFPFEWRLSGPADCACAEAAAVEHVVIYDARSPLITGCAETRFLQNLNWMQKTS